MIRPARGMMTITNRERHKNGLGRVPHGAGGIRAGVKRLAAAGLGVVLIAVAGCGSGSAPTPEPEPTAAPAAAGTIVLGDVSQHTREEDRAVPAAGRLPGRQPGRARHRRGRGEDRPRRGNDDPVAGDRRGRSLLRQHVSGDAGDGRGRRRGDPAPLEGRRGRVPHGLLCAGRQRPDVAERPARADDRL